MNKVAMSKVAKARMRKGVAVVAIFLVAFFGLAIGSAVYVNNFIADLEVIRRSARETAVIGFIDAMEFAKKALQQAVPYSFYAASRDVLQAGGFCAYDDTPCSTANCKIPKGMPTTNCKPWWRVYDSVFAPEYGEISKVSASGPPTFVNYLANRTLALYNNYAKLFFGPFYCPVPPGKITFGDTGGNKIQVNLVNSAGGAMMYSASISEQKSDSVELVERNTFFKDSFDSTALALFKAARSSFAENDWVKEQFAAGDTGMPNNWCALEDGYCDMTADCWTQSTNKETSCWDGDCCCKGIYFGDIPESDLPDCEIALSSYCHKDDINKIDECNFNRASNDPDATNVSADEEYNCTLLGKLNGGSKLNEFELVTATDKCLRVGHNAVMLVDAVQGGIAKNVRCVYDYFGTANVSVEVIGTKNSYPIDSSFASPSTSFYVASGNAVGCGSANLVDGSKYVEDTSSICCPALMTNKTDELAECKTKK